MIQDQVAASVFFLTGEMIDSIQSYDSHSPSSTVTGFNDLTRDTRDGSLEAPLSMVFKCPLHSHLTSHQKSLFFRVELPAPVLRGNKSLPFR